MASAEFGGKLDRDIGTPCCVHLYRGSSVTRRRFVLRIVVSQFFLPNSVHKLIELSDLLVCRSHCQQADKSHHTHVTPAWSFTATGAGPRRPR